MSFTCIRGQLVNVRATQRISQRSQSIIYKASASSGDNVPSPSGSAPPLQTASRPPKQRTAPQDQGAPSSSAASPQQQQQQRRKPKAPRKSDGAEIPPRTRSSEASSSSSSPGQESKQREARKQAPPSPPTLPTPESELARDEEEEVDEEPQDHDNGRGEQEEEATPSDPFANLPPGFRMPPAARVDFLAAAAAAARDPARLSAAEESLELLDWSTVLKQLAAFCQTVAGYELVRLGRMPMGDRGPEESAALQEETAEALRLLRGEASAGSTRPVDLTEFLEIRPAFEAAARGRVLSARQLNGVAQTLTVAAAVKAKVEGATDLSRLREICAAFGDCGMGLVENVRHCIDPVSGLVLDRASEALALVREARRENSALLARTMQQIARELQQKGAADNSNVVIRRDRLCVGVRAGRSGDLTKGSLVLDTSSSGATLFVEPFEAVELNNTETYLAEEEDKETQAVLQKLTDELQARSADLAALVSAVGRLDLAMARARHAQWTRGSRPRILADSPAAPVAIPGMRHPLLLQAALPSLPPRPSNFEIEFETDFMGAVGGAALEKGTGSGPANPSFPGTPFPKEKPAAPPTPSAASPELAPVDLARLPKPVDLRVPEGRRVAALTGPNTGGKTAALKALGVGALMARCGLYLPVHDPRVTDDLVPAPDGAAAVQWFDLVLADIGDGQSLQQSLSTFGGHVRRLRRILEASTGASLVLLDEVGSGTDPKEGAALAVAILEVLAESACFTLATTHHALVKEFAATDDRFVNASVEFDLATLRPTYRLLWGQAGASNALNVAQALGFDQGVVREARLVYETLTQGGGGAGSIQSPDLLLEDLMLELDAMRAKGRVAAGERRTAESSLAAYKATLAALRSEQETLRTRERNAEKTVRAFEEEVRALIKALQAGRVGVEAAEQSMGELAGRIPSASEAVNALVGLRYGGSVGLGLAEEGAGEGAGGPGAAEASAPFDPELNQMVRVLKMGGAIGRVTQAPRSKGPAAKYSIRIGTLTTTALLSELAPLSQDDLATVLQQETAGMTFGASSASTSRGKSDYRQVLMDKAMRGGVKRSGGSLGAKLAAAQQQQSFSSSLAFQTSGNTVDLRGLMSDEGISRVDMALSRARPGAVLFVVHGVGTGKLRDAVLGFLRADPRVAKTELEEKSQGGCTIVTRR